MKKFLSGFLALCLVAGMGATAVFAADEITTEPPAEAAVVVATDAEKAALAAAIAAAAVKAEEYTAESMETVTTALAAANAIALDTAAGADVVAATTALVEATALLVSAPEPEPEPAPAPQPLINEPNNALAAAPAYSELVTDGVTSPEAILTVTNNTGTTATQTAAVTGTINYYEVGSLKGNMLGLTINAPTGIPVNTSKTTYSIDKGGNTITNQRPSMMVEGKPDGSFHAYPVVTATSDTITITVNWYDNSSSGTAYTVTYTLTFTGAGLELFPMTADNGLIASRDKDGSYKLSGSPAARGLNTADEKIAFPFISRSGDFAVVNLSIPIPSDAKAFTFTQTNPALEALYGPVNTAWKGKSDADILKMYDTKDPAYKDLTEAGINGVHRGNVTGLAGGVKKHTRSNTTSPLKLTVLVVRSNDSIKLEFTGAVGASKPADITIDTSGVSFYTNTSTGGGDGGGGGGIIGGGGGFGGTISVGQAAKDSTKAVGSAVNDAIKAGATDATASIPVKDVPKLSPAVLKAYVDAAAKASAGKNVAVTALVAATTTVKGKPVATMTIDPAKFIAANPNATLNTKILLENSGVSTTFAKFFQNQTALVASFAHNGSFGVSVTAAVKFDGSRMDMTKAVLVNYDAKTNFFEVIPATDWVYKDGVLAVTTTKGLNLVVSQGNLTLK